MSVRLNEQQGRLGKQRLQKQATYPAQSERSTSLLRRTVTVPRPSSLEHLRGIVVMDVTDGKVQPSVQIKRVGFKRRYQASARPPSDIMSESGRASPHNRQPVTEAAVRPQVLRQDASATPVSPQTADIQTDEAFRPYRFRVEDLSPQEKDWFKEKIKKFDSLDVPDTPGGRPVQNFDTQISGIHSNQYGVQNPTNAFGKIHFEGEDTIGVLPSWYVRVAVNTPEELIQEMLETKFQVMNSASHPLRFHCIDYNTCLEELPQYDERIGSKDDVDAVITKLQRDLYSMCKKTAGVVLTWSGLGGSNIIHLVLGGIMEESRRTRIHAFNLASIATPPWNAVGFNVKFRMQNTGGDVHLRNSDVYRDYPPPPGDSGDAGDESLPYRRPGLGGEISQYATHFLMLDDERAKNREVLSSDMEKSNFRHFHYKVIKAMENCEKKKTIEMPVVCVLINGYHDALKMVVFALEKNIPVLVVQGSGGYADVIADVYLNAVLETTKDRDETDQVRTRITKRPGYRGEFYLTHPKTKHPLLKDIFNSLDLLTVYVPSLSVQTLDSVVFEALLKHKQEEKFGGLVEVMQKSKKLQRRMMSLTERSSFIDSDQVQMDYFIEAVKQNSVDVVKIFLERLNISQKLMHHFHMGRVLRLYSQNSGKQERLMDFRRRFVQLLQKMTVLPLRCVCEGCTNCDVSTNTQSKVRELAVQRTCLHPIQELFLWTLHDRHVEMAVVFWQRCEDKIAAALMARKVFRQMAKEYSDPDIKWQMEENVRQFQTLAIQTLRSCHNMDEHETELLLTKPCPWWGNLSVLQLAIITENREFMTQTACRNILTRIWFGKPPSDRHMPQRPCQLVNIPSDTHCTRWHRCSPFLQYVANFVMQVLFLGLFSYGLLFDLGQGLTPIFIVLIVCVGAITLEEIRQLVSKHAVLRDSRLETSGITRTKLQTYLSQGWNQIDVATVLLFWLGMVVFAPVHWLHVGGRFLLSIDIFFFFMRTFQMLMVFEELGLMLVMVYKMVKDTRNFMIILLIFVLAYTVASESLLYPESNLTFPRLFHLPRKAYWQVFGELSLEEMEIRELDSCSVNKSKHSGYDEPHCPTEYGSYIVPVLLGIYVMITNVLLLNLLIARFGVTFNKVHDEACEYQSWHRCQIITEYYNRTSLPPPFNILHFVYYLLVQGCIKVGRCFRRLCRCCRRQRRTSNPGNAYEMRARGTGDTDDDGSNTTSPVSGEQNRLMGPHTKGSVTALRSASRRSVDIVWTNDLPLQESPSPGVGQGSGQGSGQESGQQTGQGSDQRSGQRKDQQSSDEQVQKVYTVEVWKQTTEVNSGEQGQSRPATFEVVRKAGEEKKQGFTVWDLDPIAEYNISVEGVPVTLKEVASSIRLEDIQDVMEFEDVQAEWVCHQKDSNMAWLNDLHAQTETLQQEIGRMGAELKDNHVTLKDDIRKTEAHLTQNTESLQGMIKYCEQSKSVFEKIDGNFEMLNTFIKEDFERMKEKLREVKEEKKEAEKKRKEAKEKRKEAEEKRKEAEEKRKEAEEKRRTAEEKNKQTEHELEKLKEQVTQLQSELARAREQEQELQRAVQAAKGEQQEQVQGLVQTQERLQREQQQAVHQLRQVLAQVGQAVGATHLAPEDGDSSGGGQ